MGANTSISIGCPGKECAVGGTFHILEAAERGDVAAVARVLTHTPEALRHHRLTSSNTAVHIAAQFGHLAVLEHITAMVAEYYGTIGSMLSRSLGRPHSRGSSGTGERSRRASSDSRRSAICSVPQAHSCACTTPSSSGEGEGDAQWSNTFRQLVSVQVEITAVLDAHNHKGQTALMFAAYHGRPAVVQFLLLHGADPWAVSKAGNRTALHYAALGGQDACVRVLLDSVSTATGPKSAGLMVNKVTSSGYSPLMYAVAARHLPTVKALLAHSPNLLLATTACSTQDEPMSMNGCLAVTALDLAARFGLRQIAMEMLRFHYETGGGRDNDPRRKVNSWNWLPEATALRWGQHTMLELLRPQATLEFLAADELHYVGVPQLQCLAARVLKGQLLVTLAAADTSGRAVVIAKSGSQVWDVPAPDLAALGAADNVTGPQPASALAPEELSCGVCMEDEMKLVRLLPCRHRLCPTCAGNMVNQMCRQPVRCPFCRSPFSAFAA